MKKFVLVCGLFVLVLSGMVLAGLGCGGSSPTTPSAPTVTFTPQFTKTTTPTLTVTFTPTITQTPTVTNTVTLTPTPTETLTPTVTATVTLTLTVTSTPTCAGNYASPSAGVTAGYSHLILGAKVYFPVQVSVTDIKAGLYNYDGTPGGDYGNAAIYSDASGVPGTLMAYVAARVGNASTAGDFVFTLGSPVTLNSGYYWLLAGEDGLGGSGAMGFKYSSNPGAGVSITGQLLSTNNPSSTVSGSVLEISADGTCP